MKYIICVLCLFLFSCSDSQVEPRTVSVSPNEPIDIQYFDMNNKRMLYETLSSDNTFHAEMREYIRSIDLNESSATLTSYAPLVVIQTEGVKINFLMDGSMVVATRESEQNAWGQVIKPKDEKDAAMELKIREWMISSKDGSE